MKEQQAREEIAQQKDELERRMAEYQEEANRAKEALVKFELLKCFLVAAVKSNSFFWFGQSQLGLSMFSRA